MKILVLNSGGSSLKFKLYEMPTERLMAAGDIDRLGTPQAVLSTRLYAPDGSPGTRLDQAVPMVDHLGGIQFALDWLVSGEAAPLASLDDLAAIGHKLPHGGERVTGARFVDQTVEEALESLSAVVPVHNPPALAAIRALRQLHPGLPQTGTFETHFHLGHPPARYRYALPEVWYAEHGIRRYGFHSCAHRYVADVACQWLGQTMAPLRLVNCHLGSGTSVCGMVGGLSVEISSAFTPQSGTPMSTRSGDFDPFVLTYLMESAGYSAAELNRVLTKESGLLGVSQVSGDLRDIETAAAAGDERAQLAVDLFVVNILRWIGACLVATRGLDALAFSGGIGENSSLVRRAVCDQLDWLGVRLDEARNVPGAQGVLSPSGARPAVLAVKVDEEIIVARDAWSLLTRNHQGSE